MEGIQRRLPPVRPPLPAPARGIEANDRKVQTLHRRLLGREVTPSPDGPPEPGVDALDGVGIRYDISDASPRRRSGFYGPVIGFGVFGGIS